VLDEPTNHLDLESREALEDALLAFEGAVLLVSHDRALLDAVGTRTVAIEDHHLESYVGGWAEYSRVREERKARGEDPNRSTAVLAQLPKAKTPVKPPIEAKPKAPSKNAQRREERLAQAVEEAEAALRAVEEELADPSAWATKYESAKSEARHVAAKRAVEQAYAAWEEATAATV
jgi:ATP-binding cassette subfamily F protein 3